jgi:hypothetical protein
VPLEQRSALRPGPTVVERRSPGTPRL